MDQDIDYSKALLHKHYKLSAQVTCTPEKSSKEDIDLLKAMYFLRYLRVLKKFESLMFEIRLV